MGNKTNIISDLKFRGSYGQLGDDRNPYDQTQPIVTPFSYLQGYNYGLNGYSILDGNIVTASRDKGIPVTTLSWLISKTTDFGMDFSLFNGKLTGTFDWFKRKRTGLPAGKTDVVLPVELGYSLPLENLNSDQQEGEEGSLSYNGKIGQVQFSVGGNISYTLSKSLDIYKPTFLNSWDEYRGSKRKQVYR